MNRLDRIFLATDLTALSDRAFDRAVQLARAQRAELRVFHAIDTSLLLPRFVKQELREAKAHLETEIREATDQPLKIVAQVASGDPDVAIVERAKAARANLIVLGAPDYRKLSAAFRGTTVDRVVRAAPCPVLTVKTRPRREYASIVAAVDLGTPSSLALASALRLFPQARFSILHIDDAPAGASGARRHKEEVKRGIVEMVRTACAAAHRPPPGDAAGPKVLIRNGVTRDSLQGEIEALEPDLLVIGTHARTGVSKLFLGSMAEALLGGLRCDTLVARA